MKAVSPEVAPAVCNHHSYKNLAAAAAECLVTVLRCICSCRYTDTGILLSGQWAASNRLHQRLIPHLTNHLKDSVHVLGLFSFSDFCNHSQFLCTTVNQVKVNDNNTTSTTTSVLTDIFRWTWIHLGFLLPVLRRTFENKYHRFSWVQCPFCHPMNRLQSTEGNRTDPPTTGVASSFLHPPLDG